MKRTGKALGILAAVSFVGAGLAWQQSQRFAHRHRWVVLEEPIRLEDGFSVSHPFSVDVAAKYWVEVECRKTVPFDTIDNALTKRLAAAVTVTRTAEQIASCDTAEVLSMTYTADSISRHVATFNAVPNVTYTLLFIVKASLPEVAATSPAIKVAVEPEVFKEAFVYASLLAYLALGLAFVGLSFLIRLAWVVYISASQG